MEDDITSHLKMLSDLAWVWGKGETDQQPVESVRCAGAGEDLVYVINLSFNQQVLLHCQLLCQTLRRQQHPRTGQNRYLRECCSCSCAAQSGGEVRGRA